MVHFKFANLLFQRIVTNIVTLWKRVFSLDEQLNKLVKSAYREYLSGQGLRLNKEREFGNCISQDTHIFRKTFRWHDFCNPSWIIGYICNVIIANLRLKNLAEYLTWYSIPQYSLFVRLIKFSVMLMRKHVRIDWCVWTAADVDRIILSISHVFSSSVQECWINPSTQTLMKTQVLCPRKTMDQVSTSAFHLSDPADAGKLVLANIGVVFVWPLIIRNSFTTCLLFSSCANARNF